MSKVISSNDFSDEVLNSQGVVLVDFFTVWCGYCQLLTKELNGVEAELPNLKIVKIDAEENPDLAEKYSVTFYPEMLIFKDGKLVDHIDGYVKQEVIVKKVKEYL